MGWFWTKAEDKILRDYYRTHNDKSFKMSDLTTAFGRSAFAIKQRASNHGLGNRYRSRLGTRGERNRWWKGDAATQQSKHGRARVRFEMGPCELCAKPGKDRHHKDGNPGNNERSNVQILCRKCHMEVDGRSYRAGNLCRKTHKEPNLRQCVNCDRKTSDPRKGRCRRCASYWYLNKIERPRNTKRGRHPRVRS